jgi:hypothetical protein
MSYDWFDINTCTGGLMAEKDKKNTPSPNLLFFQKISDFAFNEP